MKNQPVSVSPIQFASPLIPVAAILSGLASVAGLGSVLLLLDPSALNALVYDLFRGGVTDASALQTWKIIHVALTLSVFLFPTIMAVSLFLTLRVRPDRGLNLLYTATHWSVCLLNALGILLVIIFVFKASAYAIACLSTNGGIYQLYAMVISEALMVVLACVLFFNLRRFLNCVCDSAASISYTLLNGKLDTVSIPGFTSTGFLILAIFDLIFAWDRLFTMVVSGSGSQAYYKFLLADHPIHLLSAAALLFSAGANVLLFIYLRNYKSTCERLLYRSRGNSR